MNDEFETMWKGAVVAYFKALSRHFLGWIEEINDKPQ
jgi:hypothetical protein